MTTKQIKAAARRIPFSFSTPLPKYIQAGLKTVVAKQLRHNALRTVLAVRGHMYGCD